MKKTLNTSETILIVVLISVIFFLQDNSAVSASDSRYATAHSIANRILTLSTIPVVDMDGARKYLVAGNKQFRTLWARDFSMSVTGALANGHTQAVHDSLELFFRLQRPDGLIARTIDNVSIERRVILGLAGFSPRFEAPLKAWFRTENGVIAIDSNVLVPWAASVYVKATRDRAFARRWFGAAEAALAFLERDYSVEGLIGKQPPFSDWEDSIRRTGRVALTNVDYVIALRGLSEWAGFLGLKTKEANYAAKAASTAKKLRDFFWMPDKHLLRNFEGDDHLSSDANLMAVVHHVIPDEDARDIMKALRSSPLWSPIPGKPTWPDYARNMKSFNTKLADIPEYHDRMIWLWLTALAAEAEREVGNCAGYDDIMTRLSARIAGDKTVYEVFDVREDSSLVPVSRLLYDAEEPFMWSSGVYLEATAKQCNVH